MSLFSNGKATSGPQKNLLSLIIQLKAFVELEWIVSHPNQILMKGTPAHWNSESR